MYQYQTGRMENLMKYNADGRSRDLWGRHGESVKRPKASQFEKIFPNWL
jgi:hypothetical protein